MPITLDVIRGIVTGISKLLEFVGITKVNKNIEESGTMV